MKKSSFSMSPLTHKRKWYNLWIAAIFWVAIILFVTVTSGNAQPIISSVSPLSGIPGSSVTITGTGFNATPANDIVYFGATRATVTAASATSLTVSMPVGATYAPVSVANTATSLTGFSRLPFLPTYDHSAYPAGAIGFDHRVNFAASGPKPIQTLIEDVDGDGKPDMVVLDSLNISVYRNTGTSGTISSGSFAPMVSFALPTHLHTYYFYDGDYFAGRLLMAMGDIDGDGKKDIVYSTGGDSICVIRNTSATGSINFSAPVFFISDNTYPPNKIDGVAIGDLDGDGKADIVSVNQNSSISVFHNTATPGSITTGSLATAMMLPITGSVYYSLPVSVAIGDIDGDGKPEMVLTDNSPEISVFPNISVPGTISFATPVPFATNGGTIPFSYFGAGTTLYSQSAQMCLSDLDGDGKLDIAVSNKDVNSISIFRNTATAGTINAGTLATPVVFPSAYDAGAVVSGDFDGDGKPDLAVTGGFSESTYGYFYDLSVYVYRNVSSPGVINSSSFVLTTTPVGGGDMLGIAAGDLDGDGKPDIVTSNMSDHNISVLRNAPVVPVVITSVNPIIAAPGTAVTITGNNFGTTPANNIVSFGATRATVTSASSTSLSVTVPLGATYERVTATNTTTGLGAYSNATFLPTFNDPSAIPNTVIFETAVRFPNPGVLVNSKALVSDIDGDGKPDAIIQTDSGFAYYRNTSTSGTINSSSFAPPVHFSNNPIASIGVGDVDGDGKPEVIMAVAYGFVIYKNTSSPGSASFATPVFFHNNEAASWLSSILIADMNGDGKADVVAGDGNVGATIYWNAGTPGVIDSSTITSGASYTLYEGASSPSIAVGDIDGDGRPDIAVSNNVDKVYIYHNSPQGFDFPPAGFVVGSGYIHDVVIADIDGDGKPDLAVINAEDSSVNVLRNTATIGVIDTYSFAAPVRFTTSQYPIHVAVADFNGDGKPDLLVSGSGYDTSQLASIFLNTATPGVINSSSFAPRVDSPMSYSVYATAGDIDGDGKADIVAAVYGGSPSFANGGMFVLRNNPHMPAITGNTPICVGAAVQLHDVLVGGNWSSTESTVTVGSSGVVTGVSAGTASITYTYLPGFIATTIVTVNPGGLPHITSVSPMKGNVASAVTITGTNFSTTTSEDVTYFGATKANVVSASGTVLNVTVPAGATYMPVSVTNPTCGLTAYAAQPFLQTYDNSEYLSNMVHFGPRVTFAAGSYPTAITLSDIDGDGKADMVVTSSNTYTVFVYRNTSASGSVTSSSFASPVIISCPSGPQRVTVGDMDGDGKPDLVVGGDGSVFIFRNQSSPGAVSFGPGATYATGSGITPVFINDIDGDGLPDMAVANYNDNTASVFHSTSHVGVISFEPQIVLITGNSPGSLSVTDIDGDSKPDLAVTNEADATISVWRNISSPGALAASSFDAPLTFATGRYPTGISLGDIDGDGKPDMAVGNQLDSNISVLRNTSTAGSISFAPQATFAAGHNANWITVSDVNGDGKPDLSVINFIDSNVSVFRNTSATGSITFAPKTSFFTGFRPHSVASGDIDGDGKPDIACVNLTDNTVSVLRNAPIPSSGLLGTPTVCVGDTTTLACVIGGDTWASSTPSIAVVGSSTGVVTGVSPGIATLICSGPLGFTMIYQVTVNAAPAPITGSFEIGTGTSTILSDATAGGTWSSGPVAIATIDASGTVMGVAPGSAIISYTLADGCAAMQTLNVDPAAILPGSLWSGIVSTYAPFLTDYSSASLVVDSSNNIYVTDVTHSTVKKISRSGIVTVIAGNGTAGFSGDGGPATAAQLNYPQGGLAIDASGNLYISDGFNGRIRKVSTSGIITTVAGSTWGYSSGDGGAATAATFANVSCIVLDKKGNLYISDEFNSNVRKVDTSGIISTIAGFACSGGEPISGFSGDGGPATSALLSGPGPIAVDAHGNVYIGDQSRIRKIDSSGIITTVAGNGTFGYSGGDWGPATLASILPTRALKTDAAGNIYITGAYWDANIRKVDTAGIITTIAGTTVGYSGDGGPASLASFNEIGAFDFDKYGNLFLADVGNHVIREIKFHEDASADSFSVFIDNHCGGLNFTTRTNPTAATILTTDFGDGTSSTTALSPGDFGTMYANVPHDYATPGTYSVKEVLLNGTTAIDSVVFTHQYFLCNNLAVQFYYDNNGNCMKDADESWSFPPVTVEIDSNGMPVDTQTATSGIYYTAFGSAGDIYSFKVLSAPPGLVPTCSGSGISYDTLQSIIYHISNNYIGFSCSGAAGFDLAENASFIAGRHSASGMITVNNNYCTPQTAVVTLSMDPKYVFQSSTPAPTSVVGSTVTWTLTGLSTLTVPQNISYSLDRPGAVGAWLLPGDTILTTISVTPISGDADTSNNVITRIDTVKSSYDPNEMAVIPDGDILPNTWLQYTISFENTGNDTARNIAVMDTLSDNLDINTLRLDAATAAMNIAIYNADGHNIVKFDFPKINLLDSSHHNQCDGMLVYHIKPKNGLADGTTIFNHAGIFFDDNPVVMTDTAENVISRIHGPNTVCMGSRIVMTDVPELGTWTLSNAHATVVDDTVTGVTAGVDTLTYTTTTKYGSASVTKIVTVNVSPAPITGPSSVCEGALITLSDATPAVSWSSSDMIVTVGSTGTVTGVAAGTATITCFPVSGCAATKVITVNPAPQSISGVASACAGSSSSLSDATVGGTWSSSDPGVATVGSSGIVSATAAGAAYISYALPSGCFSTRIVTVSPLPAPISGSALICTGNPSTLSDATAGGSWSSNDPAVAAVFLGTVTSTFAGTAVVSYVMPSGCMATKIVTANPSPVVISGTAPNCVGSSSMLSDFTTGGAWSSNNPAIATVGSAGLVAAMSAGAAFISYTLPSGCFTVKVVTISPMPSAISGSPAGCVGAPSSLSDAVAGGTWSSNNTTVAVIGSGSGVLTGLSAGVTTITYALSPACSVTTPVTINPTPTSILGVTSACASGSTALSNTTGGGAWSSGNAAVATVGTAGIVTGVATGTTNISYTLGSGCSTNVVVTISPLPSAISGSSAICAGSLSSLSDAVAGGNWSSSNPAIATIGFGTGVVTGVVTGTVNISYKMSPGCYVSTVVTINPLPVAINGSRSVCNGASTSLSDATTGGTWTSGNLAVGTISATGIITGVSTGTTNVSYILVSGCSTNAIITVNPLPSPISGITTMCDGASSSLSDVTTGGTWSSSNPVIASVGSGTGAVTGMSPGTANITYALGTGCSISTLVTINSLPGGISGSHSVCAGASSSLTDLTVGGTWTSGNTVVATIGSTGTVNGIAAGTTNISYTIASGCMTSTIVTVVPLPAPISSASTVCPGATIALSDVTAGGTWTASDPGIAVIAPGGLLTGIAAGTTIITYTAGTGCLAMKIVTVTPAPLPISGALTLCLSSTAALTDATSGGTWASDNITIATVGSSSGIVYGNAAGTTLISYIAGGCATSSIVTVVPTPSPITGVAMECVGSTSALSDATTGGNWSSSSAAVGSVSAGGVVTGLSAGTTEITYTLPGGCYVTVINTVNPAPSAIVNPGDLCVGTAAVLSSSPSGGSWISATPGIATVDAGGLVMAVATGTTGISYTLPGGCYAAVIVTVNSTPGIITGATTLCVGDNTDLNDAFAGGTWSSSTPGIATVATIGASTGVVIGIAPGVDTISYIVSSGCVAYSLVTVYPLPSVTATATTAGCGGKYDLTSAGALLYSWSPATGLSCTTCASNTVNPVATITYTVVGTSSFGCSASATATMNGNRILGHIIAGGAPTDTMKVWLMQINPADSSLIATDSMLTCMDGGAPYYEFDGMAAGKYMLRAKHLGSMPGATGYVPTYGASTPYWDTAISFSHAAATDTQHITMIHGVVLPGSGSISGLIISGAGRGTSGGAPAVGMLVYLLNSSDQVVTYTYTDATGAYSFSGLANGSYIVYPEDYKYYTTASALVTLTTDNETVTDINFKRHTSLGTITPYSDLMVSVVNTDNGIGIYPNPASGVLNVHWTKQATGNATVLITDLVGREVYNAAMDITTASGKAQLDISSLKEGVYIITIRSDSMSFNCKLVVQ